MFQAILSSAAIELTSSYRRGGSKKVHITFAALFRPSGDWKLEDNALQATSFKNRLTPVSAYRLLLMGNS
jgi:hypothetical protein